MRGGGAEARIDSYQVPLVLLLQPVLLPIVPSPHLHPVRLLLGAEGLIFLLFCLCELLELVAGEPPPPVQPVQALV